MVRSVTITQYVYRTPRVVLLEYLNNGTYEEVARWIVKNQTFEYHLGHMADERAEQARPRFWSRQSRKSNIVSKIEFLKHIDSSTTHTHHIHPGLDHPLTLITTAKEKRHLVADLDAKPLYEWMIKFLLEQTRTDWIQWTNVSEKEFCLYDIETMGAYYSQVHNCMKKCPAYYIKLLLASYCRTGILIKTEKKNCYRFKEEWYTKELLRKEQRTVKYFHTYEPSTIDSTINFPSDTILPSLKIRSYMHVYDR